MSCQTLQQTFLLVFRSKCVYFVIFGSFQGDSLNVKKMTIVNILSSIILQKTVSKSETLHLTSKALPVFTYF